VETRARGKISFIPHPLQTSQARGGRSMMWTWVVRAAAAMFYRQTRVSLLDSYYIVVQSVRGVKGSKGTKRKGRYIYIGKMIVVF
jgi:hypothetical protein